jgi:adenine-specific DNA-methyltransferase
MSEPKKLDLHSLDIAQQQKEKLRQLFPEVFTEDGIDFNRLKQTLGESIDTEKERYSMTWPGKSECFQLLLNPSIGTLKPARKESVNFETTENLFIEGDNLEVLKLLQKSYYGKIKMIYIDPPYNTGNDFIYPDDFKENLGTYLQYTGQVDAEGRKFSTNTDTEGRFHSKWLNMMYPRLFLAKNLLRDDGVIFISIDDNEVCNLRKICDEIFGEENFVAVFPWRKRTAKSDVPFGVSQDFEWIVAFVKSTFYAGLPHKRKYYKTNDYPNDRWRLADLTTQKVEEQRPNSAFDLIDPKTGKVYPYNPKRLWGITKDTFNDYYKKGKIVFPNDYNFLKISIPAYRVFESEDKAKALKKYGVEDSIKTVSTLLPKNVGMTEDGNKELSVLFEKKVFPNPKPISLIKHLLKLVNDENSIILDFFAGSATTAHAVLDLNKEDGGKRKFIMVQLPEKCDEKSEAYKAGFKTIADIGKERILRVIAKIKKENSQSLFKNQLDLGFKSFKLDSSNFKIWNTEGISTEQEALEKQLELHINHINPDSCQEDILFEILLKAGYQLSDKIKKIELAGKNVYSVNEGAMLICLEKKLTKEVIKAMANRKPGRVICLDQGFTNNDQLKTNAVQIMKSKGIDDFRTV